MITENVDPEQLPASVDEITAQLLQALSSFSDNNFYRVPFPGSWAAAEVYEHIIKSNEAVVLALNATGPSTVRQPDLRVAELRDVFLSTTNKYQSPTSVLPTSANYKKEAIVERLKRFRENIKHLTATINKQETMDIPGFGELTKLELLYFIIYHTQRHLRQLQNISTSITRATTVQPVK